MPAADPLGCPLFDLWKAAHALGAQAVSVVHRCLVADTLANDVALNGYVGIVDPANEHERGLPGRTSLVLYPGPARRACVADASAGVR